MLKIKLVRGLAGCTKDQIEIVRSLGLRKTGSEALQPDNAATKGKINKVIHLIQVTEG